MPEAVEEISEKPEVRRELERTGEKRPREKIKARGVDKFWFVTHALLIAACCHLTPALAEPLACDDGIKTAFRPDADTSVIAVRLVKMVPARPSFDRYIDRCAARPAF